MLICIIETKWHACKKSLALSKKCTCAGISMVTVGQAISLWETVLKQEVSVKQQANDFRNKLVSLAATQVTVPKTSIRLRQKVLNVLAGLQRKPETRNTVTASWFIKPPRAKRFVLYKNFCFLFDCEITFYSKNIRAAKAQTKVVTKSDAKSVDKESVVSVQSEKSNAQRFVIFIIIIINTNGNHGHACSLMHL